MKTVFTHKKFTHKNVTILHNADYTGDVQIVIGVVGVVGGLNDQILLPFAALKAFIAAAVREQQIAAIGEMDDDEVLGVDQLGDYELDESGD